MNNREGYEKITVECAVCKSKFDIWISMSNFNPEMEENIRKNFYHSCPVCKAIEELKNK